MKSVTFTDQLVRYSGEDLSVIKLCDRQIQNRFAAIGLFVLLIYIGCLVSSLFAFYNLFGKRWLIAVPVSIFIGWMFNNIYILLLYTLTPNLLTEKVDSRFTKLSLITRLFFIAVIAMIMAKPLTVLVFKKIADNEAWLHKKMMYDYQERLIANTSANKEALMKKMQSTLDKSSFFVYKIRVLSYKYPYTWAVDFIIIIVFFFPIYYKYRGREFNEYFKKRKYIERKIVAEEYDNFKTIFIGLISKHAGRPVQYFEIYSDAPYNTKKKTDPENYQKQEDFLSRIYGQH